MYFYIISCQANLLSTVSITKHIECVNLIIFRSDFEDEWHIKCAIRKAEIVIFWLGCLKIIWFSQVFGLTVLIMQDLGLHEQHGLVSHNVIFVEITAVFHTKVCFRQNWRTFHYLEL